MLISAWTWKRSMCKAAHSMNDKLSIMPIMCLHQDTQENQEKEGTQGRGALLALEVRGETWDPWAQSPTWSTSNEAAGGQWWEFHISSHWSLNLGGFTKPVVLNVNVNMMWNHIRCFWSILKHRHRWFWWKRKELKVERRGITVNIKHRNYEEMYVCIKYYIDSKPKEKAYSAMA